MNLNVGSQESGFTSHYAAMCTTPANIEYLDSQGIALYLEDANKKSPLVWHLKSAHQSVELVNFLLSKYTKPQVDALDTQKYSAFHHFCKHRNMNCKNAQGIVQALVGKKAKMTQPAGWNKQTPIGYAAARGDFELTEAIIETVPKVNLNKGDKYNRTPLIMACRNGHANIVGLLL